MDFRYTNDREAREALGRLLRIARQDTGQARLVANFLLAWHNAEENGGWAPVDLWSVDAAIADDMLTVLRLVRQLLAAAGEGTILAGQWGPRRHW